MNTSNADGFLELTQHLEGMLEDLQMGGLEAFQDQDFFPRLLREVRGVLDQVLKEVQQQLEHLPAEDSAGRELFTLKFQGYRAAAGSELKKLENILEELGTTPNLERFWAVFGSGLAALQESIDSLESLSSEVANMSPGLPVGAPIPREVSESLDHFEAAMKAIVAYLEEERSLSHLRRCVESAKRAIAGLEDLLAREDG